MPTKKPRVTFTLSQDSLDKIDAYRFENRCKNQTQAILSLISKGLADYLPDSKTPPPESNHESDEDDIRLIELFHELNPEGREKLLDYADDLVSSGKYIKTDPSELDQKRA